MFTNICMLFIKDLMAAGERKQYFEKSEDTVVTDMSESYDRMLFCKRKFTGYSAVS